jgi:hypothetical protein
VEQVIAVALACKMVKLGCRPNEVSKGRSNIATLRDSRDQEAHGIMVEDHITFFPSH